MKKSSTCRYIFGVIGALLIILSCPADTNGDNFNKLDQSRSYATIPVDDINNFARIYAITKNFYVESITDSKLMRGAIDGMLTNLDPHSNYLDQSDLKQLTEMTTGSFAGIGIEINRDKNDMGIKVVAPIDGTPAYKAGIRGGDVIVKIDGQPVSNLSLDNAVKKMRGKAGTNVNIVIYRKNELTPLTFNIKRANIIVKSVKFAMLTPDYAYVRITNFQGDTANEIVAALKDIYKQYPKLKGLVLDLRDNPGGILQAAVGVVAAFIPQDSLVVYTKGRAPNSNQRYLVRPQDYIVEENTNPSADISRLPAIFKTIPMVVIVNQGTASAAEIVSGALQDYKRAKIIGTNTFGKGSVQSVIPLNDNTAVKLTTALYYTPNGRSIQAQGIKPDVIVKSEYDTLVNSWDMSEATLDNHLNNPNGVVLANKESYSNTPVISPPKQILTQAELNAKYKQQMAKIPSVVKQTEANIDLKNDFQLQWALNILQGKPLPTSAKNK